MAQIFSVVNGAAGNAAAPVKVTTGTAIKTLIQLATPATRSVKIVSWWISFDGTSAATPIECELMHSTSVAATVTAYVAADITKIQVPDPGDTSQLTLGTTASGYTASAEGTITAGVQYDYQLVAPTGGYLLRYELGREPVVPVSRFVRIRVTAAAAVNAVCGITWEE